jgi:hypothetical protein
LKAAVDAQAIPLRSDREIHETRFVSVDRTHQMLDGRVHVALPPANRNVSPEL